MAIADTDERAQEIGKAFYFGGGHSVLAPAEYQLPAGYNSPSAISRMAKSPGGSWTTADRSKFDPRVPPRPPRTDFSRGRARAQDDYETSQANLRMLIGRPDTVISRAKAFMDIARPGIMFCSAPQGNTSDEERQRSMRLLAKEVLPELRDYAASIGLVDPFERKPGSVELRAGEQRGPVVDRERMESLGFSTVVGPAKFY
jgi:alkanesulfonate monooxygenase SsuD/methylene tetrahydromethanopterin reductase-like flavin-dependent oxidoreductase (luciferase family)